jgi:hypothetical protein
MNKPVYDVDACNMWNYKYQAKHDGRRGIEIIASDSINNLKREIKDRGWKLAWITAAKGRFSCGQNVVSEYPYMPRYLWR